VFSIVYSNPRPMSGPETSRGRVIRDMPIELGTTFALYGPQIIRIGIVLDIPREVTRIMVA
jgi:hypothetical protein